MNFNIGLINVFHIFDNLNKITDVDFNTEMSCSQLLRQMTTTQSNTWDANDNLSIYMRDAPIGALQHLTILRLKNCYISIILNLMSRTFVYVMP